MTFRSKFIYFSVPFYFNATKENCELRPLSVSRSSVKSDELMIQVIRERLENPNDKNLFSY